MDLRKVSAEQISLIRKACRLALITRWKGEHHLLFWKHGISIVLFDLLEIDLPQKRLSLEEQISIQRQLLKFGNLLALRNYTWDILGWLAIHCEEGFHPEGRENKLCIDWLISFTWYCLILLSICLFSRVFSCCVCEKVLFLFC